MSLTPSWDSVDLKRLTSDRMAVAFGISSVLTTLVTLYFVLPGVEIHVSSMAWNAVIAIISFPFLLSPLFLWFGMRRYQKLRDPNQPSGSFTERLWMLLGLCYFAMAYYLFVYLNERRGSIAREIAGPLPKHRDNMKFFRMSLYFGWACVAVVAALSFTLPRWAVSRLHPILYLQPLFMDILLLMTAAYYIVRFLKKT